MEIYVGSKLHELLDSVADLTPRSQLPVLMKYLERHPLGRVLTLNGLQRTGKSVLMLHAIASLPPEEREKCAYIVFEKTDWMDEAKATINNLYEDGKRHFFLDEITELSDFVVRSRVFSDGFAMQGMHIMLSGAKSFGLVLALKDELFMKATRVETTWIPWAESRELIGSPLDEYLETGGVLSRKNGVWFGEDYENSAIVNNIVFSILQCDKVPGRDDIWRLAKNDKLKPAIQKIFADIQRNFIEKVFSDAFAFFEYGQDNNRQFSEKLEKPKSTARKFAIDYFENMNNHGLREEDIEEVKKALFAIGIIEKNTVVDFDTGKNFEEYMLTQPGLRWLHAKKFVEAMEGVNLCGFNETEKDFFLQKIREATKDNILKEVIIIDTMRSFPERSVFTIRFGNGGFDMYIPRHGDKKDGVSLYKIIHGATASDVQTKDLKNMKMLNIFKKRFRRIRERSVIYFGPTIETNDGIRYINAEEFLKESCFHRQGDFPAPPGTLNGAETDSLTKSASSRGVPGARPALPRHS